MLRILIIDDDAQIRRLLSKTFERESFAVSAVSSGEDGLRAARSHLPDLIILDINLPGMSGIEVCQALKRDSATASAPILMITGNDREGQEIVSLELGADDYLTKPFALPLMLAHARALLRRGSYTGSKLNVVEKPGISVNIEKKTVTMGGETFANLTPKEFDLLCFLLRNDKPAGRDTLYRKVWGIPPPAPSALRTVDVHVQRIRVKLGLPRGRGVVSVSGRGYQWKSLSEAPSVSS
jgi:DNA-binding response OmpR family regulator